VDGRCLCGPPPCAGDGQHTTRRRQAIESAAAGRQVDLWHLTSAFVRPALSVLSAGLVLTVASRANAQAKDTLARPDSTAHVDTVRAPLRLCAGGDVTLGTNLDTVWAKTAARKLRAEFGLSAAPDSLLAPLKPLFADADVVLINVEGAIGAGYAPAKCGRRALNCFAFRQPVATARALRG